jgi:hypothetical protein
MVCAFDEILNQSFSSHDINHSGGHLPNPVKIVRRMKALELAMAMLRKDCEIIFQKRSDIVQSVVVKQNKNVQNVEKVRACSMFVLLGKLLWEIFFNFWSMILSNKPF